MSDSMPMARIANAVHIAQWKIFSAERDSRGDGSITVTFRGGFAAEMEREVGILGRYIRDSGDVSAALLKLAERADCVLVGEIVETIEFALAIPLNKAVEPLEAVAILRDLRENLVPKLTAILGGTPFPEAAPRPYADHQSAEHAEESSG
jgi:hypothetical protein